MNVISGSHAPQVRIDGDLYKRDSSTRIAGTLLISTAALTALSAVGRLAADADQPTLAESLEAISRSAGLYGLGGGARLLAGIALAVGAKFLLRTWIIRGRRSSPILPVLFSVSGVFTAMSGICALSLAISVSDRFLVTSRSEVSQFLEVTDLLRWVTGKTGFAVGGLALVVVSRYQWSVGGPGRVVAPISALLGLAMQFIWIDSATLVHPTVGAAFFLWLLAVGVMLYAERTEESFLRMLERGF